jgi:hypothetical protein
MKTHSASSPPAPLIPLWLKISYTAFMAVLVPIYWHHYGLSNFLYFCDVALFLTLVGVWKESPLLISLPAVGIFLPQLLWCVDFLVELSGHRFTGLTSYMFDEHKPLYLRGLSLFHGWLPWLLLGLLAKVGYDRRALWGWSLLTVALCLFCYIALPPAGAELADPNLPRNVNYVFGMDDAAPQTRFAPLTYLTIWITGLIGLIFVPTHLFLKRCFTR